MKQSTYKMLVILLALTIIIGGCALIYQKLAANYTLDVPTPTTSEGQATAARDFTVEDAEGNAYKLSDFRGKPVVVNFWASWCNPCKIEMPHFQSAWENYGDEVEFMMVNLAEGFGDSRAKSSAFLEEGGFTFPVYYDNNSEAAIAYGMRSVPMTLFVDKDGNISNVARGMLTADRLDAAIQALLAD